MKKFVLKLSETTLDEVRHDITEHISKLSSSSRRDGSCNELAIALKQTPALKKWWNGSTTLAAGHYSLGKYLLTKRKRPVGDVELILARGSKTRLLIGTDDPTIDLADHFQSAFVERYWVRFTDPNDDDWFVGNSAETLLRKKGFINAIRSSEPSLYVSTGEKFQLVCDLQLIRAKANDLAIQAFIAAWKDKHELRKLAQAVVDAHHDWVGTGDVEKLKLACNDYLERFEKTRKSKAKSLGQAMAIAFQVIAEDLSFSQSLTFLTHCVMRDVHHEISGKKPKSRAVDWNQELTDLDRIQLAVAHNELLATLSKEKKSTKISKLVLSKVNAEKTMFQA